MGIKKQPLLVYLEILYTLFHLQQLYFTIYVWKFLYYNVNFNVKYLKQINS